MKLTARSSSMVAIVAGGVLVGASLAFAWITAKNSVSDRSVIPLSNDVLQTGAWLLAGWVIVGIVVFVATGSPAVVGGAGALSLNLSAVVWMVGSKASWIAPLDIVPDDAAIRLGHGASLGLVGSVLVVAGSALALADRTWSLPSVNLPRWTWPAALALILLNVLTRQIAWANVDTESATWAFDFGAIPVLGDGLAAIVLTSIGLLVVYVLRPQRWVAGAIVCMSAVAGVAAVIALTVSALTERAVRELLERIGGFGIEDSVVTTTNGPVAVLALSGGLLIFGVFALRHLRVQAQLPGADVT
jgi:hypothetical protein